MPAIITHDFFGRRVLAEFGEYDLDTDSVQAFLLGNQGPDPFFYAVLGVRTCMQRTVGQQMHHLDPARIILELNRASREAPLAQRDIIRAFAAGFICHYLLDSYVHPLVVAQQQAFCAAGVPGLTKADETDVHLFIERDIDEVSLYTTLGVTIADFDPSVQMFGVNDQTLGIISKALVDVTWCSMGIRIPDGHFARCVRQFRLCERALHSPTGQWRDRLGRIETKFRRYSFCRNMMLRPVEAQSTPFMNPDHEPWADPFSGEVRTESFCDLAEDAIAEAVAWIPKLLCDEGLSIDKVREMTKGRDFSGASSSKRASGFRPR